MAQASGQKDTSLAELTHSTAGFANVLVKGHKSGQPNEYTYTWSGQNKQGKRQEYVLVSTDSNIYCIGVIVRKGTGASAESTFNKATQKFQAGTIWRLTRVVFAKERAAYVGAPVKHVIDLALTKCAPVLQSTVSMPPQPTPVEDLVTLLDMVDLPPTNDVGPGASEHRVLMEVGDIPELQRNCSLSRKALHTLSLIHI